MVQMAGLGPAHLLRILKGAAPSKDSMNSDEVSRRDPSFHTAIHLPGPAARIRQRGGRLTRA